MTNTYYLAPSFASFAIVSDPYLKNGKEYIDVRNPSTGTVRSVRSYSQKEWNKLYGAKQVAPADGPVDEDGTRLGPWPNFKRIRGFSEGYVTLLKATAAGDADYLKYSSSCWHCLGLGWYVPSQLPIPNDLPSTIKTARLPWEEFHGEQGGDYGKPNAELEKIVRKKFAAT